MVTERWMDEIRRTADKCQKINQLSRLRRIYTIQWYNIIVAVTICARLVPASLEPYRSRIHLFVICCFVCSIDYLPFTFDFTCSIQHSTLTFCTFHIEYIAHCLGEPYQTISLLSISQPIHDFYSFRRFLLLTHLNIMMLCIA